MRMWKYIVLSVIAFTVLCLFYLGTKITDLLNIKKVEKLRKFLLGIFILITIVGIITFYMNLINAIICTLYLSLIWFISDSVFWMIKKIVKKTIKPCYIGWLAIIVTSIFLSIGWYQAHNVWKTEYTLTTDKNIPNLKIALISDSHIGTTFDSKGFEKHLEKIQDQNPDILVVVGDFVDDSSNKQDMIQSCQALGKVKTKYGVYFVFGNHDKGYYNPKHRGFTAENLVAELTKNGVKVLQDEAMLIDKDVYLIGRKDNSQKRKTMKELISDLDSNKYMIVLDHQPTDYKNQEDVKVDLVLSGHTHGGQLFPLNQIGKWIGANDAIYGNEKRGITDFIVTSGISDWNIKFKTGTKSEYVILTLKNN